NVQNPSCPTVTIVKGVDCFKLVVSDGHLDQRIKLSIGIYEVFPISQLVFDNLLSSWWSIDTPASDRITDICSFAMSNTCSSAPNLRTNICGHPNHYEAGSLAHAFLAMKERDFITQRLARCRSSICVICFSTKQLVGCSHNIFDLGARLSFQQRQRVHETARGRQGYERLVQSAHLGPSIHQSLEYANRLKVRRRG